MGVFTKKNIKIIKTWILLLNATSVGKLALVQYNLLILLFTGLEEQCLAQKFCKLSEKVTF